jgi:Fur family peroxide stress response transcriptional regulator
MSQQTRRTKKREAIYALLCSVDCHPSAQWVYERMREQYPQLSLGNGLPQILPSSRPGKVRTVRGGAGAGALDANTADHVHMICTQCGAWRI